MGDHYGCVLRLKFLAYNNLFFSGSDNLIAIELGQWLETILQSSICTIYYNEFQKQSDGCLELVN